MNITQMKNSHFARPQNRSECSRCFLNFKRCALANNANKITDINSTSRMKAICSYAIFIQIRMHKMYLFISFKTSSCLPQMQHKSCCTMVM